MAPKSQSGEITIQRIGRSLALVRVKGTAPLIVNKFSEKARQMMLDKQMGKKNPTAPKDPESCFEGSLYRAKDGGFGFPATGFKAAIVGGARYFDGVTMTGLKQSIFIRGEGPDMLVTLDAPDPTMREDTVRNQTGVADIRFRGMFDPWAAVLPVVFVPSLMSLQSVVNLIDAAGMGGIGEWRPSAPKSATGMYGTFEVDDSYEITEVKL